MASTIILSDNGASSGSAGIKTTGGNDGVLILQTTTSGGTATNAVYINNTQKVGIGTASPTNNLTIGNGGGGNDLGVSLSRGATTNFYEAYDGTKTMIAGTDSSNAYIKLGSLSAHPVAVVQGNGNAIYIDTSKNVGIGTNSPTLKLSVSGSLNVTAGNQIVAGSSSTYGDGTIGTPSFQFNSFNGAASGAVGISDTTTNIGQIYFRNPNGFVGNISTSGSNTTYTTTSDYRLKENIALMAGALAVVQQLKPCTYNWKVDGSSGQGFIAHELQEVVPDCVSGEKDGVDADGNPRHQSIDTSFLVATLTAAIQEQQALITTLTERINALEAK